MEKNIFVFLILLMSKALAAQDIIFKQNGDKIKSKITEISPETIKYKEFDFLDGPVRVLYVKDVLMIIYQNGKKEVFAGADNKNQKSVAKAESPALDNVTKPSAQKETPQKTNAMKSAAQKEKPPQTNTSKPSAQEEMPLSSGSQQDTVLTSYSGPWISKTLGDLELVVTNEGFKIRYPAYPNNWLFYKPTKHPEYVCYQVDAKGSWKGYINSKITFIKSDKFELNYYGNPHYFSKPPKAVEIKKLSFNDLPVINGFWKTVSDKVFAMPMVFELAIANNEFKITNNDDTNLWAQFRVTTFPEFECYQVNGKKMLSYQGSKATIEDIDNINIIKQVNREKLKLIRTRVYKVNDDGELFVNKKKIAIIKKTASGSVMNTTMPEFTIYDINNKPWIRYTSEGKYLFLDDNKSYIPRKSDAHINGDFGIAQFFAGEDILTPEGFNSAYRAAFIEKYEGFDAGVKSTRDRTAPVQVKGSYIYQRGEIIGTLTYKGDRSAVWGCEVYDMNKKLVSRITFSEKDKYNMVHVVIYLGNNSSPERHYDTMWSMNTEDEAVKWLVEKNHL